MKPFFVYMLRCGDGTYYVGHTDELERRVAEHRAGDGDSHTSQRLPVECVWSSEAYSREEALAFERRVKGWSRAKKEALIDGDWKRISELAKSHSSRSVRPGKHSPVRPEPVEGHRAAPPALRQAQGERSKGDALNPIGSDAHPPVRPEPVEGHLAVPPALRQAQGERGAEVDSILRSDRRAIAKAITLLESTRADHREQADALLANLLPHTGNALRLGISGVPGVGKSTFIEAFGLHLIAQGHRVAVLTIDPSSSLSGGSILGDKTRMEKLSTHDAAYIRPSPSSGTLGGVAEKTREAMLVLEAARYSVVIVETVGIGQSETAVADMTDIFVLMQLPNAGDDLQAIKRGVMELADLVVINKADLDAKAATRAEAQISGALKLFGQHAHTKVIKTSALQSQGIDTFWQQVKGFVARRRESGEFDARRKKQGLAWMWSAVHAGLQGAFKGHARVQEALPILIEDVTSGHIDPSSAARRLLDLFEQLHRSRSP